MRLLDTDRPVDVALALKRFGLSLRKAHGLLTRLAAGETVAARLWPPSRRAAVESFARLGVRAEAISLPAVDAREVRERTGLSQEEFAIRFGFHLDTLRNWEQDRYRPDAASRVVLAIIRSNREAVDSALDGRAAAVSDGGARRAADVGSAEAGLPGLAGATATAGRRGGVAPIHPAPPKRHRASSGKRSAPKGR